MTRTLLRATVVLAMLASMALSGQYVLDNSHTSVVFKVKHLMISNVPGEFNSFDGSFTVEKGKLTALNGIVDVDTIDTGIEKRDNHLRSADFFDVKKYPKMTLQMVKLNGDELTAYLTIKGIKKLVEFDYEFGGEADDPWGNHRAGFTLEGKISRKDFGLKWNKALETGGFVVGDTVKITIEVEGIEER